MTKPRALPVRPLTVAALTVALLTVGCHSDPEGVAPPAPYCAVDEEAVAELLARMSLREKVAQMYLVGVVVTPWFEVEETRALIEDLGIGGVYIQPVSGIGFWPEWTARNTNRLQTMALSREGGIPLFIAIDQEGGIPQSVNSLLGGTDTPGNLGLGATFDPDSTYRAYSIMGQELAALGVSVNFSPVLGMMISHEEVSMYTRSFGERTAEVTAHAGPAVRGLQDNRVIATGKHFPNHSTTPGDEHYSLTVNDDDEATLREVYLPPFTAAIDAGLDMMMMTHSVYTAWDPGVPSGFSRVVVTDLLREELGFDGVIVTDDINMGAISLTPWREHPDVQAIAAGVDMIVDTGRNDESMFGTAPENRRFAVDVAGQIDTVLEAVRDGRIRESSIDESVGRILRTKMKYCLFEEPCVDVATASEGLRTAEQLRTAGALHEKSLTLVRNDAGLVPVDPAGWDRIHVIAPGAYQVELYPGAAWGNIAGTDLVREVQKRIPTATGETYLVGPDPIDVDCILQRTVEAAPDLLVVGTYHALYLETQTEMVRRLLDLGIPTVVIATAMPYDLMAFPEATTYLVTYSNRDLALETAVRALFGDAEITGRLPVSLPGLYDVGWRAASGD